VVTARSTGSVQLRRRRAEAGFAREPKVDGTPKRDGHVLPNGSRAAVRAPVAGSRTHIRRRGLTCLRRSIKATVRACRRASRRRSRRSADRIGSSSYLKGTL